MGEFSFLLARLGRSEGVLSEGTYSIALTAAVVTMGITPFAARAAVPVYARWRRSFPADSPVTMDLPGEEFRDHVVILGLGRVGGFVARMLKRLDQPFVVVDVNPAKVDEAKAAGIPLIYGDAAAEPVLEAAGVGRARLVVLTISDAVGARLVVERTRRMNPQAHVVARSVGEEQLRDLADMGVYEAVQPEFEAGLELGRQALIHMDFGAVEIQRFSDSVRRELYAPISNPEGDENLAHLHRAARMIESDWIELPDKCDILGRTIGDLHIRGRTGASIVALVRGDEVVTNPGPDLELAPGDTLSVLGTAEQRSAFLALIDDPDENPRSP